MVVKASDLLQVLKDDVRVQYFIRNREGDFVHKFEGTVALLRERRFITQGVANSYVSYFSISGDFIKGFSVCIGI